MAETKPSGLLINLALLPFALVGVLVMATCGACGFCTLAVQLSPDTDSTQVDYLERHGLK